MRTWMTLVEVADSALGILEVLRRLPAVVLASEALPLDEELQVAAVEPRVLDGLDNPLRLAIDDDRRWWWARTTTLNGVRHKAA